MLDNGLPKEYAKTILSGIWDNMEILPKQKFNNKDNKFNFKMNKNLILIFTNPELGKVKTRLAASIETKCFRDLYSVIRTH
jgi:hypothetical protein